MWTLLASLLLAAPQDAPPPEEAANPADANDPIVIRGLTDKQRRELANDTVRALTDETIARQVPRFYTPICPMAVGLKAEQTQQVEARMRQVAAELEVGAGEPGCKANMLVVFTDDRSALLDYWKREFPEIVRPLAGWEREVVRKTDAPAVAWQIVRYFDENGLPVQVDPLTGVASVVRQEGSRRLRSATKPATNAAIVVVDRNVLRGIDTRQMADYALMRGIAPVGLAEVKSFDAVTILDIFEAGMDEQVPLSLSQWDFAFLKALHKYDNLQFSALQRGRIRNAMLDELEKAAEAAEQDAGR